MSKLSKGFTLVELTVAMAISTVVLASATALLFAYNNLYQTSKNQTKILSDMRMLSSTFYEELNVDENSYVEIETKNIAKEDDDLIFTIRKNDNVFEYYYNVTSFSKIDKSSDKKEVIFSLDFKVLLLISKVDNSDLYKFTFTYGKDLSTKVEMYKAINYEE